LTDKKHFVAAPPIPILCCALAEYPLKLRGNSQLIPRLATRRNLVGRPFR
jgi:hypothetical protein